MSQLNAQPSVGSSTGHASPSPMCRCELATYDAGSSLIGATPPDSQPRSLDTKSALEDSRLEVTGPTSFLLSPSPCPSSPSSLSPSNRKSDSRLHHTVPEVATLPGPLSPTDSSSNEAFLRRTVMAKRANVGHVLDWHATATKENHVNIEGRFDTSSYYGYDTTDFMPPAPFEDQRPFSSRSDSKVLGTTWRGDTSAIGDERPRRGRTRRSSSGTLTTIACASCRAKEQKVSKTEALEKERWSSSSATTVANASTLPLSLSPLVPPSPTLEDDGRPKDDGMASMTRQEFEALPPAVQRKYFSTIERFHFAQLPPTPATDLAGKVNASTGTNRVPANPAQQKPLPSLPIFQQQSELLNRRSSRRPSFYLNLPDKIKRQHLTSEEQIVLARLQRPPQDSDSDFVSEHIRVEGLDPFGATPAILYNPTMELSRLEATHSQEALKKEKTQGPEQDSATTGSIYDSLRWLGEDEELDLRLYLDDYHANLREDLPTQTKSRPTFRRHLSISKLPFGRRSSFSSSRPGSVTSTAPGLTTSSSQVDSIMHGRQKSRALSLISPRQSPHPSISTFDVSGSQNHDIDTDSRYTLLSSPSELDEHVMAGLSPPPGGGGNKPAKHAQKPSALDFGLPYPVQSPELGTFLADDRSSIYSNEGSMDDSESPKTPQHWDKQNLKPLRMAEPTAASPKPSGEFIAAPSSREVVTVRMTLTRPDLRANDEQIYGWQYNKLRRRSQFNALREDYDPVTCALEDNSKESIERQFAAMDQWHAQVGERGVMKRMWHKVRRA